MVTMGCWREGRLRERGIDTFGGRFDDCMVGHKLLPVYNRGGMLTWLFTKIGKKMEIKMISVLLWRREFEYTTARWHCGSSSSAKLRMLLLESGRIASYWPQHCGLQFVLSWKQELCQLPPSQYNFPRVIRFFTLP
jgi:hypothetical protein